MIRGCPETAINQGLHHAAPKPAIHRTTIPCDAETIFRPQDGVKAHLSIFQRDFASGTASRAGSACPLSRIPLDNRVRGDYWKTRTTGAFHQPIVERVALREDFVLAILGANRLFEVV